MLQRCSRIGSLAHLQLAQRSVHLAALGRQLRLRRRHLAVELVAARCQVRLKRAQPAQQLCVLLLRALQGVAARLVRLVCHLPLQPGAPARKVRLQVGDHLVPRS
jgi:hypothetical protein